MTPVQFNRAMGAVIRKHRKIRGMTLEHVGIALEVTFQQIQKYENGSNALSAYYAAKLAALFGVPVADLFKDAYTADSSAPNGADNDGYLAARYVAKISDPRTRQILIDMTRKFAYRGEVA